MQFNIVGLEHSINKMLEVTEICFKSLDRKATVLVISEDYISASSLVRFETRRSFNEAIQVMIFHLRTY